jgi:hypothetical protein
MVHHNHWDLEVIARDLRQSREREAARARLANQARQRQSTPDPGSASTMAGRLARAVRTWLTAASIDTMSQAPAMDTRLPEPMADGNRARHVALVPRNRAADPYAAMLVIARPALLEVAERPCGVGDC